MAVPVEQEPQAGETTDRNADWLGTIWRAVGPVRFSATLILILAAVLIARFSWAVPVTQEIERVLYDVRASLAMTRIANDDPRITVIVYDEDTLFNTEVRSPLNRQILADALTNIDAMNPESIAVDVLIDQPTPSDQALIDALNAMTSRTYLAYVSSQQNPEEITPRQEDFIAEFYRQVASDTVQQTSVYLRPDSDNVLRSWPPQPPNLPPLMANSMAPGHDSYRTHSGSIAYRQPLYEDGQVFTLLPIDFVADTEMAGEFADVIAGRHVLIGTNLQDRDRFETPLSRVFFGDEVQGFGETVPGVVIHAHLLAQMLDDVMLQPLPNYALWITAMLVVLAGALTTLSDLRLWKLAVLIFIQAAFLLAVPYLLHQAGTDTQSLPVFGWGAGWLIAFVSVGAAARSVGAEKRLYVQGALNKYLPVEVANQILADPDRLTLNGEKREIYALFTDLEGFTKLSHAIEPEMVARLLNRYLDALSETVLEYSGTIDKFVGDAVVAFWGAPISHPDDADRAAQCAVAMWEAGEKFRASAPPGVPPIGRTRVGLHFGEAIVGNFGGDERIQYTALGDAMNTAARLEGANKHLDTAVLVSKEVRDRVKTVTFRPQGRVTLSGRATPVEIYEPVMKVTAGSASELHRLYADYERGDADAARQIADLAGIHPDDLALTNLANRLVTIEAGESYVLQSK